MFIAILYYIAAFLLLRRLNKSIADLELKFKWNKTLSYASWGLWVLFIVDQAYFVGEVNELTGVFVLAAILFYLNRRPDFAGYRFYLQAHYPLVAAGLLNCFLELVAPESFYHEVDDYLDYAIIGAFVWIYARWVRSKKQREEINAINARNTQLDNLVAQRTAELTQQKNELEDTVKLLQATQTQLIQQEKLASLGELTAGIAHEIQNPLNFVNNFSEVSMELVDEIGEELAKGDTEEVMAIAADLKQNLEKILHHGKRADAIVKNMLQHSRANSGEKQLTDINALADEYLRLSYHGLRAKDKMFNAVPTAIGMLTHFDERLPLVPIIPQDIGRVLLNLFNNAFYAVNERTKLEAEGWKPEVTVTTFAPPSGGWGVSVKDNGNGIPDAIKDKIMQPFFTTKPTGEGTGLGLSLSYDIVVKGHGGKINVDTREGEGAEFTIYLPLI